MKLEFVYKNRDSDGNPIIYDIVDGSNLSISYNEDLSIGTFIIHSDTQIDIESFDEIKVLDLEISPVFMCVDSFEEQELRNRNGDKVYSYNITVMSQTKLLENHLLPSLSITPKTNGGLSIYDYLERYNNLYGPKIRTVDGYVNKFSFSPECATKFADACPELQFNAPTLRECFTLLMQVKDCIPIVSNNVIGFIDISKKQSLRDKNSEYISYVERSQTANEYSNNLKLNMKNVIQDDNVIVSDIVCFRNNDSGVVNSNNAFLYTQHPIYEIIKAKMKCIVSINDNDGNIYRTFNQLLYVDVTELFVEKKKWDVLKMAAEVTYPVSDYPKYQNTTVFYTRGSNKIDNFSFYTRWGPIFPATVTVYDALAHYGTQKTYPRHEEGTTFNLARALVAETSGGNKYSWYDTVAFEITYKTKANLVARIEKSENKNNYREVVDNQSNNYVNAFTQGLLEYAKANRLGNTLKTYYGRYPRNYNDLPQAGDYFEGNEIIYKVDYQVWSDCIDATMHSCPNYVLRNYFTGVQSKLRSWKIVDTNEAFYREENYKIYLEFSKNIHIDTHLYDYYEFYNSNATGNDYPYTLDIFMSCLTDKNTKIEGSIYKRDESNNFILEVAKNVVGNSIIYTFGFDDNFTISRYFYQSSPGGEGGNPQQMWSYCDNDGNQQKIILYFSNIYPARYSNIAEGTKIGDDDLGNELKSIFSNIRQMPRLKGNVVDWMKENRVIKMNEFNYFKDNKEIPKFNLQIEYCSDTQDIVIGEEFMRSHLGNGYRKSDLSIKVFDNIEPSNILPSGGTDLPISNLITNCENLNYEDIQINGISETQTAFIVKGDKVLLSFKGNHIYCNPLKDRRKQIYRKDGNDWIIDGEI